MSNTFFPGGETLGEAYFPLVTGLP